MKNIRAHHLICMTLFEGAGYDEAFAENMKKIIAQLEDGEELSLKEGADDICRSCPNNSDGSCSLGDDDVSKKDRIVLSACGLDFGAELSYKQMRSLLGTELNRGEFEESCGTCRWYKQGYCSYEKYLQKLKNI